VVVTHTIWFAVEDEDYEVLEYLVRGVWQHHVVFCNQHEAASSKVERKTICDDEDDDDGVGDTAFAAVVVVVSVAILAVHTCCTEYSNHADPPQQQLSLVEI
jgi:hypothetical protein